MQAGGQAQTLPPHKPARLGGFPPHLQQYPLAPAEGAAQSRRVSDRLRKPREGGLPLPGMGTNQAAVFPSVK